MLLNISWNWKILHFLILFHIFIKYFHLLKIDIFYDSQVATISFQVVLLFFSFFLGGGIFISPILLKHLHISIPGYEKINSNKQNIYFVTI